jgi:hypothetical protein
LNKELSYEITGEGMLVLTWSSQIILPEQRDENGDFIPLVPDEEIINLQLTPTGENMSLKTFNWTVEAFNKTELVIKLNFTNPLEISSGYELDHLEISFVQPRFFLWADTCETAVPSDN